MTEQHVVDLARLILPPGFALLAGASLFSWKSGDENHRPIFFVALPLAMIAQAVALLW